nr:hypothetical protein CFP56_20307 [Quercus suber]
MMKTVSNQGIAMSVSASMTSKSINNRPTRTNTRKLSALCGFPLSRLHHRDIRDLKPINFLQCVCPLQQAIILTDSRGHRDFVEERSLSSGGQE